MPKFAGLLLTPVLLVILGIGLPASAESLVGPIQPPTGEPADGFRFDVRGGALVPGDWDSGYSLGVSMKLFEVAEGTFLYPGVWWTQATSEVDVFGGSLDLELGSIAVGGELRYFASSEAEGWYVGSGTYFHLLDFEVASPLGAVSQSGEEFGFVGLAGYQFGQRGTGFAVEGRYSIVSGFDHGQLLVGYRF